MSETNCRELSYDFSVKAVTLCLQIARQYHEYDLTNQLKRSAASICANLNESEYASSRADFINKMNISLKEANESKYWISLLHDTKLLDDNSYEILYPQVNSIINILTASLRTLRTKAQT